MKRYMSLLILVILTGVLAACGGAAAPAPTAEPMPTTAPAVDPTAEPTAEPLPSIAEIAAGDPNFSTLVAALDAAGLVETLAGEGSFTVFAPTNDAFAALPAGTVDALLADPTGDLTQILLYHVVDGVARAADVVNLSEATTLNGAPVAIAVVDGGVRLNESVNVVTTDIEASNGVIHVIDGVLLPPAAEPTASIAEIAAGDPNFSTLVAALDAAGLVETLAGEGSFTVFAPTNDAFAALPAGTVEGLLEDPQGALTDILLYHVVDGVARAEDVVGLTEATTLNGAPIAIAVVDGGVRLNDSVNVVTTDIEATNGVIHVIDGVLLPPADEAAEPTASIAEIAAGDPNFSTLVAALDAAGLVETLAGEGDFTVFAPTNDAFAALPAGTVETLLADPTGDLTQILLYHVLGVRAAAANVVNLTSAETLQGSEVSIDVVDGGVVLNDAVRVVTTDIPATNGVIHVIDAVLIPPAN